MALMPTSDTSPADWIFKSDVSWVQVTGFGPPGFPAYARMRFLPDPTYEGQREHHHEDDVQPAGDQWRALLELLARHTTTPDDCYFCLWEGWGLPSSLRGARLSLMDVWSEVRSYLLFRGSLADAGDWGADVESDWMNGADPYEPAFIWPADRAWCVANDVDPHWAGVGGGTSLIGRVLADRRLDVVAADPKADQPAYR